METNVVRQPIIGRNKDLLGYELLYQDKDGSGLYQADTAAANAIEDFLLQFNSEKFLEGKTAFITFTPNLLLRNIPKIFQPNRLVIQIEDNSIVHPLAQKVIYRFRKQGYSVAVKDFEFSTRYFSLLDIVDYIKVDMSKVNTSTANVIQIGQSFQKKIIAYNVNTREAYDQALQMKVDYLQGTVVAEAMSSKVHRMEHLQSNFFQLMVAITKDEPDVDEIAEIISRDVTLTFSLLKLVNSAYFALRNRVNSVKQALVVLGLGQLKQWIYLLSFKDSGTQLNAELIKTSFLRANFCSELSYYSQGLSVAKSDAYLMGMFSTLELLLEVPLEKAQQELPVIDEIKEALIHKTGPAAPLYRLVLSYEDANWAEMAKCASELGISENIVSQKYFECVEYVNNIWRDLMMPNGDLIEVPAEEAGEGKPAAQK